MPKKQARASGWPNALRRRCDDEKAAPLAELHDYLGVTDHYAAWQRAEIGSAERTQRELSFFRAITIALLERCVPAFKPKKTEKIGRPKLKLGMPMQEYLAQGGTILTAGAPEDDARARFAEAVHGLEQQQRKSRSWIFRWLASSRHPERRQLLPESYRSLKTSSSLQSAYSAIPARIRKNPSDYLLWANEGPIISATRYAAKYGSGSTARDGVRK